MTESDSNCLTGKINEARIFLAFVFFVLFCKQAQSRDSVAVRSLENRYSLKKNHARAFPSCTSLVSDYSYKKLQLYRIGPRSLALSLGTQSRSYMNIPSSGPAIR